jgi:uncharacterized protein
VDAFHSGEVDVQARLGVRGEAERVGRIIGSEIPLAVWPFLREQRTAIVGSVDDEGRPWASLLTGPSGFVEAADSDLLRIAAAPVPGDPLAANLRARPELGVLLIDLAARRRMRLNGRSFVSREGIFLLTDAVYGNCNKYIQKRRLVGDAAAAPGAVARASSLDERTRAVVSGADTFFIASWHPRGGADASHRGGRPGFVRVRDERTLELPDYPGNNMFNTLGNLVEHPHAGLLFVDFATGDLLQLTARAEVLFGPETSVRFSIEEVRATPGGSPLRFELVEPSAVNPPLAVTP